jgi:hypothetical protein
MVKSLKLEYHGPSWLDRKGDPISKINRAQRAGSMTAGVECLPEIEPSSARVTTEKEKGRKKEKERERKKERKRKKKEGTKNPSVLHG